MVVSLVVSIILALLSLCVAVVSLTASMRYSRRLSEWSKDVVDQANRCINVNCSALQGRIVKIENKICHDSISFPEAVSDFQPSED